MHHTGVQHDFHIKWMFVSFNCNIKGVISGSDNTYPSEAPEFTLGEMS